MRDLLSPSGNAASFPRAAHGHERSEPRDDIFQLRHDSGTVHLEEHVPPDLLTAQKASLVELGEMSR
jgi:hypothetical protein